MRASKGTPTADLDPQVDKLDLIFEATGNAKVRAQAMEVLAHNDALVWTSITGGSHNMSFDAAKVNLEWVLGNKPLVGSVNGNHRRFELGIQALSHGESTCPGVAERILTHAAAGLERYQEMMSLLEGKDAPKVFANVAERRRLPFQIRSAFQIPTTQVFWRTYGHL